MAERRLQTVLRHLLSQAREEQGPSDAILVERFADHADEAAFELLLWRHQRLVYGVCRRMLGQGPDAEDAFQATFLILARRARSVKRQASIGPWLYRVATHTAMAVRSSRARKKARECSLGNIDVPLASDSPLERQELWAVVDEEVRRLPQRLQAPIIHCYFEAKTIDETARILGCPPGTVASRLARARERLSLRLKGRGLTYPIGVLAAGLAQFGSAGAGPANLVRQTIQVILAFSSLSRGSGLVSTTLLALTQEVLRTMFIRKMITTAVWIGIGILVLGSGVVTRWPASASAEQEQQQPLEKAQATPVVEKLLPFKVGVAQSVEFVPYEDFVGSLINSSSILGEEAPPNSIGVEFEIAEVSYLRYRRLQIAGVVKGKGDALAVALADETDYPHKAVLEKIQFNDYGKQRLYICRAIIAKNPNGLLEEGLTARVRMNFGPGQQVLEVPEDAIHKDETQEYLWIVNNQNRVEKRPARFGSRSDSGMRRVGQGLKPQERIILEKTKDIKAGDLIDPQSK